MITPHDKAEEAKRDSPSAGAAGHGSEMVNAVEN